MKQTIREHVECFQKVCFARTGSPCDAIAFERALRLCERAGAQLNIASAIEVPPPGMLRLMDSLGISSDLSGNVRDESAEVDRLVDLARRRNVTAAGEVLHGAAALEIIRKVQKDSDDLLVKAAQPSTVIRHVLFGHTDRQLVRKCPCPVWIENSSRGASHQCILAAVDPAPFRDEPGFDPVREDLNASILRMAIQIAQLEEAELHVVHVWQFYLEGPLQSRAGLTADAVAEVGETFKQKHEQALATLLGPFMHQISRVHLLKGQAAHELPRLAASESIDVLVMGTVCRTGIAGWLIGNTAESVLNHVDCSLVALKPSGFDSPVGLR